MDLIKKLSLVLSGVFLVALLSCSKDPASSAPTSGSVMISLKNISGGSLNKVSGMAVAATTLTTARVVIEEIEFESSQSDTFEFEFEQPFVQDLTVGSNLHEIQSVQVPFGSYEESQIKIDELNEEDQAAYYQNPELRNRSIYVTGYLNGDPNQMFMFLSDLSVEQEREFNPPLVLDENSPSTNIVLTVNMDIWFVDSNGNPLDPRDPNNQSIIEQNIKNSIGVFEDEDGDGEDD
jgi:hypothetical protein